MSDVNPTIKQRWRSGRHVGPAKPRQVVRIQAGLVDRDYRPFRFLDGSRDDFGKIAGHPGAHSETGKPWHGFWRATGPWIDVPNVSEVTIDHGFNDNGIGTATVQIENVLYRQVAGIAGAFHAIQRGALSPTLGFRALGRIAYGAARNEWYEVFTGGYRIKIWQGYGDSLAPVFTGLIDDTDTHVSPDTIILTSRSFGQLLTDSRVFGSNKQLNVRSPITFADRLGADDAKKTSAGAAASTADPGYPARAVMRPDDDYWRSDGRTVAAATEWLEIRLPKGRYEDFYLDPQYEGMECFISVYARHGGLKSQAKLNGAEIADGWVHAGQGDVPGANGGFPYIRRIPRISSSEGLIRKIGAELIVGDNSIMRLSFRNLYRSPDREYRAGVRRLVAYKRPLKPGSGTARKEGWVLVDDASDVVKWALMWAGFHEWEVESFGARIKDPKVFDQSTFLIDVVKWVEQQGDYVFFMAPPTEHTDSIGVPVFRHTRALTAPPANAIEVRDTQQLTGLERKFSREPLSYIIRVRGREAKAGEKGPVELGGDTTRRVMGVYLPSWSGAHHSVLTGRYTPGMTGRLPGARKHVVHTDLLLTSNDQCVKFAVLIAIKQALAAWTATVEIPGLPGLRLDDQVSVLDATAGMNTRLWLAHISSRFSVTSDGAAYTMSLGGSEIDTYDLQILIDDLRKIEAKAGRDE